MRHAQNQFLNTQLPAALDHLLQRGNQGFGAFDAEALGSVYACRGSAPNSRHGQPLQDGALARRGEFGLVARDFDARLDPLALFEFLYVHEFDADMAAIGARQASMISFRVAVSKPRRPLTKIGLSRSLAAKP